MATNKVSKLRDRLIDNLLDDLNDPSKCTPGLYQVVRGVITDNQDELSMSDIVDEVMDDLANEDAPFKFGT